MAHFPQTTAGQSNYRSTRVFQTSDFDLFCDLKGVVDLNAKVPNRALIFLVPKKQLRRPQVPCAAVDESHLRPPHGVCRKLQPVEADPAHPF